MKPVFQTIFDGKNGDCMRAAIASLLELDILQVPHFALYDSGPIRIRIDVFHYFMLAHGYEYCGNAYFGGRELRAEDSIGGYFYACVPSLTFEGMTHAVVINDKAVCVHDPNPNKRYLNKTVRSVLHYWFMFEKRSKTL